VTLKNLSKAPFPYFGGKTHAAPIIWRALGDPAHFVDPFCGSLAALLLRPALANRAYYSETVNDLDGLLVNAWRAIQLQPQATAEAASWPVSEADLTARHLAILKWKNERELERLMADPHYCDPVIGGWWIWGISGWIGGGWCDGTGPWVVGADGRVMKMPKSGAGVSRQLPHVSDDGQGVNHARAREPGVKRQRPHVNNNGQGVNVQTAREPGVKRQLPHVSDNGRGVTAQTAREPGVNRQLPHVSDNGRGVNHAGAREHGVAGMPTMDDMADYRALIERDYAETGGYHPMTMPEVRRWFDFLSARLRHVRILNGDWRRAVTKSAVKTLSVRMGDKVAGVFLDPPYSGAVRDKGLYARDDHSVAADVREWCKEHGDDPKLRIVLAGFAGEGHESLEAEGWRAVEWFTEGHLRGGMAHQKTSGHQQHRERLWLSPHCLDGDAAPAGAPAVEAEADPQPALFAEDEE
jgi:hypothetical protein